MKEIIGNGVVGVSGGFGNSSLSGAGLFALLGGLNFIFGWWTGIPLPIVFVACVLGPIGFAMTEANKKPEAKFANTAGQKVMLVLGVIIGAIAFGWLVTTFLGDWFLAGGKAWLKLIATLVGGFIVGAIGIGVGSFVSTGGK